MHTEFYLVRHGQSESNVLKVFAGHSNPDLSPLGYDQGKVTAGFFKEQGLRPDAIYSSDLKRAYNTAVSTAEVFSMPIVEDKGLREIFAGQWEQESFDVLIERFPDTYGVWKENIGCSHCDGGESALELQVRVVDTLTRIAKAHDGQKVFIFTHATPIRVLAAHGLNDAPEQFKDIPWATNASVTKVIYEDGVFRMEEYSRDDVMGQMRSKMPANV